MKNKGVRKFEADEELFSRRKMIAAMGMTSLATVGAPLGVMASDRSGSKSPSETEDQYLFFNTVDTLKKSALENEGVLVRTGGYYKVNDGGGAEYIILNKADNLDRRGSIDLGNGFIAVLINVDFVNYKMFGAIGDGQSDDGPKIKAAHAFANEMDTPVRNISGDFWIDDTYDIEIKTNVQWGQTVFNINEKYNTRRPRFRVVSRNEPVEVDLSSAAKESFLSQFKPGVSLINELALYKNCYMIISDSKDRIGYRAGKSYGGKVSRMREELFYVEEHGRIIGDIAWEFKNYTSFMAYPVDKNYLIIDGGVFLVTGDTSESFSTGYVHNGFNVERSRTIIRNQWMGLADNQKDTSMVARNGFYSFRKVFDCLLENVRLIPWEKDREDKQKVVPMGTYGLGGSRMFKVTFRNITAEGSTIHWGVFGTNINKDFRIENCRLNRVDVHFHCWNLYIGDTEIGYRGISITGGGDLLIENTKSRSRRFVSFRKDYGGKWDGSVTIRNCKLISSTTSDVSILSFLASNFDYKYPIGYAHKIKIEDFVFDYQYVPDSKGKARVISVSALSSSKSGPLFFPEYAEFRNIFIEGRNRGMRLFDIQSPSLYVMKTSGAYDAVDILTNSYLVFDNIHLEKIQNDDDAHFTLRSSDNRNSKFSLFPRIEFKNCKNLKVDLGNNSAEVAFDNCSISGLQTKTFDDFLGRIDFNNCKFKPTRFAPGKFYKVSSTLGTSFTNCILYLPTLNGESRPDLLDHYEFIEINSTVKYNHLNTRLGADILNYFKEKNVKLSQAFINMLKSHHELED